MAISSNTMSMQSLSTIYTLGLTTGGAINLITCSHLSDKKQEIVYTLGAGIGALTMGIFWKYIINDDETKPTTSLPNTAAIPENNSEEGKLTAPEVFALGMFAGTKLGGNSFRSFFQGAITLGLALYAKKQEQEGRLNWKKFGKDCP